MFQGANIVTITVVLCSLLLLDYALGNGLLNIILRFSCRVICFVRKVITQEANNLLAETSIPINIPTLISEAFLVTIIAAILNRYGRVRSKDRIDELLEEGRRRLRCTNDYLDKWRRRRILTEHSYLDEEPQVIAPFKLEIPILHMAIIGTRGSTSSQHERGDAGDSVNGNETALLSMTSLIDDYPESLTDPGEGQMDESQADKNNRHLWNVLEEETVDL